MIKYSNLLRIGIIMFLLLITVSLTAEEILSADALISLQQNINIVWTSVAAFLVFFMQAGFAMVETGLTRAQNTVNIMMKNLMDFAFGTIAFFLIGFGLMFGASNGLFGTTHFLLAGTDVQGADWAWTFLIF